MVGCAVNIVVLSCLYRETLPITERVPLSIRTSNPFSFAKLLTHGTRLRQFALMEVLNNVGSMRASVPSPVDTMIVHLTDHKRTFFASSCSWWHDNTTYLVANPHQWSRSYCFTIVLCRCNLANYRYVTHGAVRLGAKGKVLDDEHDRIFFDSWQHGSANCDSTIRCSTVDYFRTVSKHCGECEQLYTIIIAFVP